MIAVAALFTFVWLAQIVPAQIAGTIPAGVADTGTPTSPVHVLDLAIFLPALATAGVLLLRRTALGYVLGPPLLVFLALTAVPTTRSAGAWLRPSSGSPPRRSGH